MNGNNNDLRDLSCSKKTSLIAAFLNGSHHERFVGSRLKKAMSPKHESS